MKWLAVIPGGLLLAILAWALTHKANKPSGETPVVITESSDNMPAIPSKKLDVFATPVIKTTKRASATQITQQAALQPELAIAVEPIPVVAQIEVNPNQMIYEAPSRSPFDLSLFAAHAAGSRGQVRDFSEMLIEAKYHIDEKTSVGVGQEAKKLYEIAYSGEDEFLPGDTRLFLGRELSPEFLTFRWDVEMGATLPISNQSSANKHVTRPHLALRASRSFFGERLELSYSPYISYSFNQYATDRNGQPLQKIVFGQAVDTSLAIVRNRLYLKGWAKGYHRTYEEFDFSMTTPAATQSFDIGSALALRISDQIGIEAGVSRGTSVLSNVRYDSGFYDSERTRAFAALRISL